MMSFVYDYPRPMVTVDGIISRVIEMTPQILLIKRSGDPFKDCWALPGGFVDEGEDPKDAIKRELREEIGIDIEKIFLYKPYGEKDRDPRGWCISIVYYGSISSDVEVKAGDDAKEYKWFTFEELEENKENIAFDHFKIIFDFYID